MMNDTDEVVHDEITEADSMRLAQWKIDTTMDADAGESAREAANEDMRYVNVPGGMWEGFLETDFKDRVRIEMDLVSEPRNEFVGEWDQNRTGVEFKADDGATTDEDVDLINGIYRFDFRKGSGKLATDNAVDEVATCGFGAMKLATEFEDDADPENDNMVVVWRPIYNAYSMVVWDQAAKRIDKADARRCTLLEQYTSDSFKSQWPGRKPVSAYTPDDLRYMGSTLEHGGKDDVFVATRYEVVQRKIDMHVYNNLMTGRVEAFTDDDHDKIKDELAKDDLRVFVRTRKVTKQTIDKTVFSGNAILEKTRRVAGKWIPIIPFYGFRAYVDGMETYSGIVRPLKDAGRIFNVQMSQLTEAAASGGQEVPVFAKSQMMSADVQEAWADRNEKPFLIVDPLLDENGQIVSVGPVGYSKPGALDQNTSALLAIVPDFIQNVTGSTPNEAFDSDMSGKAMATLIKRSNLKTSVISNHISDAIVWSGTVYQEIAKEVYNSSRIMQTVGKDGTEGESQMLKVVVDQQTGMMVEANDLSGRKFQSYADAGPQYETLAEQAVEELKGMMTALAGTAAGEKYQDVMVASMIENMSGVGMGPLKDFNRKIMLTMGLVKPVDEEEEKIVEASQQPKEDPQQKLVEAAAMQQQAEAESLQASAQQKTADAGKKLAETQKIQQETGLGDRRIAAEQQRQLMTEAFKPQPN